MLDTATTAARLCELTLLQFQNFRSVVIAVERLSRSIFTSATKIWRHRQSVTWAAAAAAGGGGEELDGGFAVC